MCIMHPMQTFPSSQPIEIVVRLRMLTTAEGGRISPATAIGGQYRPQFSLDDGGSSTSFLVEASDDGRELRPGATATVRGWLLVPEVLGDIQPGLAFVLREGLKVVARGSILQTTVATPTP